MSSSTRRVLVGLEPVDLVAGHRLELVVGVGRVAQVARAGQLGPGRLESPEGLDDRFEPRQLLAEPADGGRVGRGLGARQLGLEVVVLSGDLGQLGVEVAHDPGGGSVGAVERGPAITGGAAAVAVAAGAPAEATWCPRGRGAAVAEVAEAPRRPGGGLASSVAGELAGSGRTVSPSATSACSIETMATSIMSSLGCLVVIIWTSSPG